MGRKYMVEEMDDGPGCGATILGWLIVLVVLGGILLGGSWYVQEKYCSWGNLLRGQPCGGDL